MIQNLIQDMSHSFFQGDEDISSICLICQKRTDEDDKLRRIEKTATSLKNAAAIRTNLTSDKHEETTRRILSNNVEGKMYHPSCHRHFTAVKRPSSS